MKYLLIILSLVSCSKINHLDKNVEYSNKVYEKFEKEIEVGDCWTYEFSLENKAYFINNVIIKENSFILLAKDKETGTVLIGQPIPECQYTFNDTIKCGFWIRSEKSLKESNGYNWWYGLKSIKTKCPKDVTVENVILNASAKEKQFYNLSKIKK